MTTFGFLSVAPVREGSMAEDVAAALGREAKGETGGEEPGGYTVGQKP